MEIKKREILKRGYITYALTDDDGKIYGLNKTEYINFSHHIEKLNKKYYWSEIYNDCKPIIIRKGTLLLNKTESELQQLHTQSKINLIQNSKYIGQYIPDSTIPIYKIDYCYFALNGWNGEKYTDCFQVDEDLCTIINPKISYYIIPIYEFLENGDTKEVDYMIESEWI